MAFDPTINLSNGRERHFLSTGRELVNATALPKGWRSDTKSMSAWRLGRNAGPRGSPIRAIFIEA
jgi:hypothetical protein